MAKNMKIFFVLPSDCEDEHEMSVQMQQAFELCRQNQMIPEWISETNCTTSQFSKTDIVVFDKFEGEAFSALQSAKSLSIVGPWCITTCLIEGIQVPNNNSPVYNMAMNKLVVTASNYSPEQKKNLRDKVMLMGGIFSLHVTSSVTHLITNSVRTQKYMVANERKIAVMLDSWVEDVWEVSLTRNVKAADAEFMKHKCPVFKNLRVSCTGFEASERSKLQKILEKNGGSYSGKLVTSSIDVLVCSAGIKSAKYDVAKKAKIPCVRMEWITESLECGYTIPEGNYLVEVASSTPTKNDAPLNPDFSMISAINANETQEISHRTSVSDTFCASIYNMKTPQFKTPKEQQKENKVPDFIDAIDLKQVKQAGAFLDGCGIYVAGFSPEKREKLCRILKGAGATRYDDISDRVTQIIVGDPETHEVRLLKSKGCPSPMVSAEWLVECIKQKQPVFEEPYFVQSSTKAPIAPSSPLSKKGLTLLQHDTSIVQPEPEPPKAVEPEPFTDEIKRYMLKDNETNEQDTLAQLLAQGKMDSKISIKEQSKSKPVPEEKPNFSSNSNEQSSQQEETCYPLFEGMTFKLVGHSKDEEERLSQLIEEMEGKVVPVKYKGITDYAVVPVICSQLKHTATEVVNNLWVLDCYNKSELVKADYYHQPVYTPSNGKPLENCVITISGYSGLERSFIIQLVQHLGAAYQDKFARVAVADQSVRANTHLVCMEATGSKYKAAIRWQKHVVTHKWILRCAETNSRLDEEPFFLSSHSSENETSQTSKTKIETPLSNKRDIEGRRISPQTKVEEIVNRADDVPQSCEKKLKLQKNDKAPEKENSSFKSIPWETLNINQTEGENKDDSKKIGELKTAQEIPDDFLMTVEDGRKVEFGKYMKELRDQGLFDTPSPVRPPFEDTGTPYTEIIARLRKKFNFPAKPGELEKKDSEPCLSQGTPVGRYLRSLQEKNLLPITAAAASSNTPDSPIPRPFYDVKTPETPLGRFLEEEPSRETRKHWQKYIDNFPHYKCHDRPPVQRRPSTPWSEVKRQAWSWLLRDKNADPNDDIDDVSETVDKDSKRIIQETESQREVSNQIGQLQDMLRKQDGSSSSRSSLIRFESITPQRLNFSVESTKKLLLSDAKESQADTVGWDEPIETAASVDQSSTDVSTNFVPRKFMLSSLEQTVRDFCCNTIKSLGGEISELSHYDPTATHVVCLNPTKNEKVLSGMAAGNWIVHVNYIQKSGEAGRFLNEELFEFGNPKSAPELSGIVETTPVIECIHWWHQNVLENGHGAFHGMRALIFSKNKSAVSRLIEAGEGVVVQANPPFNHSIDVSHCFIDVKLQIDYSDFVPLAEQGVQCLNVLYLSNYLNNRSLVNENEFVIPKLSGYYK